VVQHADGRLAAARDPGRIGLGDDLEREAEDPVETLRSRRRPSPAPTRISAFAKRE
jgi:hypothetical protein